MSNHLENIIQGCLKGDRLSQRKLYEQFYSLGLNLCLRYARSRDEAREMLNDGFLKVFRKIDRYNPAMPFQPWLRRLLVNAAIDYHHKHHKHPESEEIADYKLPPEAVVLPGEMAYEDLLKAVQALPPAYRMAFNLHEIEGYKHAEIAEMLNISVGTSKSNLARAKSHLKKSLQPAYKKIKKENV